jgi:Raf kinase inhibitor-like YbhB/YbcL family protein
VPVSKRITIVGAGSLGKALAFALRKNGVSVKLFDRNPERTEAVGNLREVSGNADFIFICVPAAAVPEVIETLKTAIKNEAVILCCSKGVIGDNGQTAAEFFKSLTESGINWLVAGGPMLSEEILNNKPAVAVFAGQFKDVEQVRELFSGTQISVEYSSDPDGVAIAGVMKNIYATGIGIAEGLETGSNLKGYLVSRSIGEMVKLTSYFGGREETVLGSAGLADLVATVSSESSRNRTMGRELAKSGDPRTIGEGYRSAKILAKRLGKEIDRFPIFKSVAEIIEKNETPRAGINKALGLKTKKKSLRPFLLIGSLAILIVLLAIGNQRGTDPEKQNNDVGQQLKIEIMKNQLQLKSQVFENYGQMPKIYTCDGDTGGKLNPPLEIVNNLENSKSLALVVSDPDAPGGNWVHWVVWNIPPNTRVINQGAATIGAAGKNSFGRPGYDGPCPPKGSHRYVFRLYSLNSVINLSEGATAESLENSLAGRIIQQTELIGLYGHS